MGVTTYAWDPQDRLVAVYKPSQRTFTFVYNAAGQRITRQTYAGERKFVYDRNKPLVETDAGAQTTLTYDYSNRDEYGELLSRRHQGVTDFHQYDALVSTRHLLDEAQSPTDGYIYRAFGKVESKSGATENHQLYVGRYGYFAEEELGLYFLNARYYDLETHQFISRDRIEQRHNRYCYVRNNAVNAVDPSGLVCCYRTSTRAIAQGRWRFLGYQAVVLRGERRVHYLICLFQRTANIWYWCDPRPDARPFWIMMSAKQQAVSKPTVVKHGWLTEGTVSIDSAGYGTARRVDDHEAAKGACIKNVPPVKDLDALRQVFPVVIER